MAVRIRNAKGYTDISEAGKKKLRFASGLFFALLILAFAVLSTVIIVSAHKDENRGWAFMYDECFVVLIIGYLFLSQVIIMILLVVWLFVETKRAVDRERNARQDGKVTHTLMRERCTYATISTFFGLSYIGRFVLNT